MLSIYSVCIQLFTHSIVIEYYAFMLQIMFNNWLASSFGCVIVYFGPEMLKEAVEIQIYTSLRIGYILLIILRLGWTVKQDRSFGVLSSLLWLEFLQTLQK